MILRLLHVSPAGIVANKTTTVGLSPALHDYDAHYNKVKLCANFPPFKWIALCVHYTLNTEKKEDRATRQQQQLFYFPTNRSSLVGCVFPHTSDCLSACWLLSRCETADSQGKKSHFSTSVQVQLPSTPRSHGIPPRSQQIYHCTL